MNELKASLGFKGENGLSAYEVAVKNGYVGSEQDWLATLGTSSHLSHETEIYTTVSANEDTFDLPEDYTSNSYVEVYVNGLKLNSNEYTIDAENNNVTLSTPLEVIGTKVEVELTDMSTNELPIVTSVDSESTDDTTLSAKGSYQIKQAVETNASGLTTANTKITALETGQTSIETSLQSIETSLQKVRVPGIISVYAGDIAPSGWLICDGSAVSRTTYPDLFSAIGTTYGAGDGTTTFNLPNLKGKIPVGYNNSDTSFDTLGETGGEKTHTLTTTEMPSHSHNVTWQDNCPPWVQAGAYGQVTLPGTTDSNRINLGGITINNTGGSQAHNNLQPYIVLNYIIQY